MAKLQHVGVGAVMLPNEPPGPTAPTPSDAPAPSAPPATPALPLPPLPPMPTVPYPSQPAISLVPAGARTWLQAHPLVLPVGGSIAALIIGLTIGAAVGRRRAPRTAF